MIVEIYSIPNCGIIMKAKFLAEWRKKYTAKYCL